VTQGELSGRYDHLKGQNGDHGHRGGANLAGGGSESVGLGQPPSSGWDGQVARTLRIASASAWVTQRW
jgi:hypothetical protein